MELDLWRKALILRLSNSMIPKSVSVSDTKSGFSIRPRTHYPMNISVSASRRK
jgi:hypothetical protein